MKRGIILLSAVMLLTGCSSVKSIFSGSKKRSHTVVAVESGAHTTPVISSSETRPVVKEDTLKIPSELKTSKQKCQLRHEILFSENESAHVRLPIGSNNPFSSSGELVLPFSQLKEEFCYPYPGKMISGYGKRGRSFHCGIDIKATPNDTIRAVWPGVVRLSKPYSGYGNVIVIRHYNGIETVYGHQSRNLVSVNDVVEAGTAIGLAGRTGRATTEHVHFEIRIAGETVNPLFFVDPDNHTLRDHEQLYCYNRSGTVQVSTRPSGGYVPADLQPISHEEVIAPLASASSSSGSGSRSVDKNKETSTKQLASGKYYYVKKGDTLSRIAKNYSISVAKLCALNSIKTSTVLQIKQKLRVK